MGKRWSAALGKAPHGEEGGAPPCLSAMEREREREWQRRTGSECRVSMGEGAPHTLGGKRGRAH